MQRLIIKVLILDMNNDIEYECVPSALFNTYGIKKDNSCEYLRSVYHGGLDYVKSILNKNNTSSHEEITFSRRWVLAHCGGFGTFGRKVWAAGTTRTPGTYRTTLRA